MSEKQIKDQVREQFGGSSAAYAVSATHRAGNDLDRLVEIAGLQPEFEALDIATGAGHTARAIAPFVAHVVISDITPEMLDTARAEMQSSGIHNVSFRIADAEDLAFPADTFDVVTCRIAPHHFPNVDRFVEEVARVLKPNGIFLLIDSTAPDDPALDQFLNELEWRRDHTHIRSLTKMEWQRFLRSAGLTIEVSEDFPKTHDFLDWTRRSRMTDAERDELERWLLDSPASFHEQFRIEVADGRVISFTDRKTLFRCRKVSS